MKFKLRWGKPRGKFYNWEPLTKLEALGFILHEDPFGSGPGVPRWALIKNNEEVSITFGSLTELIHFIKEWEGGKSFAGHKSKSTCPECRASHE